MAYVVDEFLSFVLFFNRFVGYSYQSMLSNTKMDFVAVHNCTSAHVKLMCFDKRKSDVIDHTMIGIAQPPCPHITAAVQVLKKKKQSSSRCIVTEIWGQGDGPQYGKVNTEHFRFSFFEYG